MAGDQGEAPEVKLPALVEQRVVDVLLKDHCAVAVSTAVGVQQASNPADILLDFDTRAPIGVLTRFDDPNVFAIAVLAAL